MKKDIIKRLADNELTPMDKYAIIGAIVHVELTEELEDQFGMIACGLLQLMKDDLENAKERQV